MKWGSRIFLGNGKILNRERSFFAKTAVRKRYEKEEKRGRAERGRGGEVGKGRELEPCARAVERQAVLLL